MSNELLIWRNRLPDISQNLSNWHSILQWRINLFNNIKRNLRNVYDESRLADITDIPWCTLQLVRTARKHQYENVGLMISQSLQNVTTLDVTDAFYKVREQVLLCVSNNFNGNVTGGLNIINTTNLDFFTLEQRAEMFRLKGVCSSLLGNHHEAHDSYSRCVQLTGKGRNKDWISWSKLCYNIWEKEFFQNIENSEQKDMKEKNIQNKIEIDRKSVV